MKAAPANVNGGWGGGGSKCGGGGWRRCDFVPLKAAQAIQRNISVTPRRKGSSRTLACGREERCRPCRAAPHTHSLTRAVAVEVRPSHRDGSSSSLPLVRRACISSCARRASDNP